MIQIRDGVSTKHPRSENPAAGLPRCQGRRGLSDGTPGTDAARAEPGESRGADVDPLVIDFATGHGSGIILRELGTIHVLLRDANRPCEAAQLLAALGSIENEIAYIRGRVKQLNEGHAPVDGDVGGSLNMNG